MKTRTPLLLVVQLAVIVTVCTMWSGATPQAQASGYVITWSATPPASGPAPGEAYTELPLGLYTYSQPDLYVPGPMPIVIRRVYRSEDLQTNGSPYVGLFGIGTELNYNLWLYSPSEVGGAGYTSVALILPNGGRVPFNRTSSCTQSGCTDYTDAVFTSNTVPDAVFFGATISYDSSTPGWDLKLKNGTVYGFGVGAPLQFIRDRNGNQVTLTWSSGQSGLLTRITSSDGRFVALTYSGSVVYCITDDMGQTVYYGYNSYNQLIGFTDALNHTTSFGWTSNGGPNITSITDPAGNVTNITYDSSNRLSAVASGSSTIYTQSYTSSYVLDIDANNYYTAFFFDGYNPSFNDGNSTSDGDPNGYLVSHQDPWGYGYAEYTNYTRGGSDLVTDVIEASGTSQQRDTHYTYDGMGNTLSIARNYGGSPTATTSYTYDPTFNQVTSITDPDGNTTTIGYDSTGDPTSVTDAMTNKSTATYNSMGEVLTTTDPMGNTTQFAYDSAGDLTSVTDPLNYSTSFTYDFAANVKTITDPLGNTTSITYNAARDVTSVTDALNHTTSFQYDQLGRRTQITDANSNSTTTTYSGPFGTRTQCDALNECTSYTYNVLGELTQQTDPLGTALTLGYDGLRRVVSVSSSGSASSSFQYDLLNHLTQASGTPLDGLTLDWNALDQLTEEVQHQGTVYYGYDAASNRTSMTANDQNTVYYYYDKDNRITSLTNGTFGVSLYYDGDSRRTQLSLPNGVQTNYGYNADSHLTSLQDYINGTLEVNLSYMYDADGRRSGVNDAVSPPAAMGATYSANNQIATWNGQTVGTDADGHITSDPSSESTFAWGNGWLSQITNDAYGTYEYPGYDLLGRRNSEGFVVPCSGQYPQSTYIVYDGLVPVQEQYTEVTSDCATYSYPYTVEENLLTMPGSGEVLALTDSNGANMVPLHDALGSTLWMVNSSGQMQTTFAYSSFGMPSQSGTAYYFPWLFAGMEWSDIGDVSQQYYAGARYYSPGLRRFISPDPMGFAGSGSNLFAYAGNDPVNNSDPTGLYLGDGGEFTYGGGGSPADFSGGGYVYPPPPPQPGQGWGGQWPVQPFAGPPTSIAGTLMAAQSIQDGATPTRNDYTTLAQENTAPPAKIGDRLYRLYGGNSPRMSTYWGSRDPRTMQNPAKELGLPRGNTADRLVAGRLNSTEGVITRPAASYEGNPGGAPEVIVPNPETQLEIEFDIPFTFDVVP